MTLLKFGSAFDIQDLQYWRSTRSMVEQVLESGEHDMDQVLDIASLMKEFGMLSNKVLKQVSLTFAKCKNLTS